MPLWTDLIDPATLSGYAREHADTLENSGQSLAVFLPNRTTNDIVARFNKGVNGLVEIASYRAFDAEPEAADSQGGEQVTIDLPAVGQERRVPELEQLRTQSGNTENAQRNEVLKKTREVVKAIVDATEYMRGIVLETGRATATGRYRFDADFGRPAENNVTANVFWPDPTSPIIRDLTAWKKQYKVVTGLEPGVFLTSEEVLGYIAYNNEFSLRNATTGQTRPAGIDDINSILRAQGLPYLQTYDRLVARRDAEGRLARRRVLSANKLLMLPAPTDPDGESELGGTIWGRTLTSTHDSYQIAAEDQPGIVAGVYRGEKPPMIAEIVSDAIALPVLANAELSLAATVAP